MRSESKPSCRGRSVTILEPALPPWASGADRLVATSRWRRCASTSEVEPVVPYWADRNSRWHRYEDLDSGPLGDLHRLRSTVDPTCIFWG